MAQFRRLPPAEWRVGPEPGALVSNGSGALDPGLRRDDETVRGILEVVLSRSPAVLRMRKAIRQRRGQAMSASIDSAPARRATRCPPAWPLAMLAAAMLAAPGLRAQDLDAGFTPSFDDSVRAIAVEADGRIVVGGQFGSAGGQARPNLARVSATGAIAPALAAPDDRVNAIALQADGGILIGGEFDSVGGSARVSVARLLASGALDPSFVAQVGTSAIGVTELGVQANGRIVIAGGFTTVAGQPRDGIARLHADGSLDAGFVPPVLGGAVDAMLVQADGKVVIAGFLGDASVDCNGYCVLRLAANGAVDAGFAVTRVVGTVWHFAGQADAKILVSGSFGSLGTHATYFVGRLGVNGAPDLGFANTALRSSTITRIVPLADGRIAIAGEMRWGTAGTSADRIARLEANGARDTSFSEPALDSMIIASALQPDQRLLVGGMFAQVAGQPRARIARLTVGTLPDEVFDDGFE